MTEHRKKITNYYELLEVQPDASNMDIINAYRQAKLTFKANSVAAYSLFDNEELAQIRTEIDQAYHILTSIEKRRAYDDELANDQSTRQTCYQADSSNRRNMATSGSEHDNVVDIVTKT